MRIFIALDIDDAIRERVFGFVEGVRNFAPDARWVKDESLHVTLKFIGQQADSAVEQIKQALSLVRSDTTQICFRGYGFFPSPKSARVFWIGIEAGPELAALASAIDEKLSALGIPTEERQFNPHLTLARAATGSGRPVTMKGDRPNRAFHLLQERLSKLPLPEFGTMKPREFFLYQSQLSPKGSKYTKLAAFPIQSV